MIWPSRFIPDLDKTLTRFGDWSVQMRDVRADQKCIWKCLLWDAKPLTKHMVTYDLLDPYEQISVKCKLNILIIRWPSFYRCYFQMYSFRTIFGVLGSNHDWRLFLGIQFSASQYWSEKMACHRFGEKPLSKRVLTKLIVTNMSCVWRRPFPGQNLIKI